MAKIIINTDSRNQMLDITAEINRVIPADLACGVCHVFTAHTTAALTVNENADRAVQADLLQKLALLVPHREPFYRHAEGNSDAHLKCSLIGMSVTLPIRHGRLDLGIWQAIYFCEFDGPRQRTVQVLFQAARE